MQNPQPPPIDEKILEDPPLDPVDEHEVIPPPQLLGNEPMA